MRKSRKTAQKTAGKMVGEEMKAKVWKNAGKWPTTRETIEKM